MRWDPDSTTATRWFYRLASLVAIVLALAGVVYITVHAWTNSDMSLLLVSLLTTIAVLIGVPLLVLAAKPPCIDAIELDNTLHHASLQRDSLLAVINNLKNAVIGTNPDGRISIYNASALNLLDTNLELELRPVEEVLQLQDAKGNATPLFELISSTKTVETHDDVYIMQGNEQLRLEMTISPIRSSYTKRSKGSSISGYILIIRDITKAKSLEEEKDEFISVVSHELRTPITVAEGTISNVLAMIGKKALTPEKEKEAIETAHSQVVFLSKMINDLSTLSRAERGLGGEVTKVEVAQLVRDLYNEYKNSAEKKHLHLNLDMPVNVGAVLTSELYLKELLQNLISNALKYTEDGSVTISATQDKQTITLSVKDTGIGISKSDQAHIMERFFRSEDYRTRETGGTGLGLYVADKLARKIGTRINLRSRLNHGSTFWIELEAATDTAKD